MARPRLEDANPDLALFVVKLAMDIGVKPAARVSGLSKNTIHRLIQRNNVGWAVEAGRFNRRMERMISRWAGVES